jgi:hypothetical protein
MVHYTGTGSGNVALGNFTLFGQPFSSGNIGTSNTAIGSSALFSNETGSENTAVGDLSLRANTSGNRNTALGRRSLWENTLGSNNVALGFESLASSNGNDNIAVGRNTGIPNGTGSWNVFIGSNAGSSLPIAAANKLVINNSTLSSGRDALIYGDFAADSLLLNARTFIRNDLKLNGSGVNAGIELGFGIVKETNAGRMGYGLFTPNSLDIVGGGTLIANRSIKFWAEGGTSFVGKVIPDFDNAFTLGESGRRWSQVWSANGTIQTSDANLKTNIQASPYGLNEVLQLNPVQYNWKEQPDGKKEVGLLAQEVLKLIPEAVVVPEDGSAMGMKYSELIPVLIKAIQEQQLRIENLEAKLKKQNEK